VAGASFPSGPSGRTATRRPPRNWRRGRCARPCRPRDGPDDRCHATTAGSGASARPCAGPRRRRSRSRQAGFESTCAHAARPVRASPAARHSAPVVGRIGMGIVAVERGQARILSDPRPLPKRRAHTTGGGRPAGTSPAPLALSSPRGLKRASSLLVSGRWTRLVRGRILSATARYFLAISAPGHGFDEVWIRLDCLQCLTDFRITPLMRTRVRRSRGRGAAHRDPPGARLGRSCRGCCSADPPGPSRRPTTRPGAEYHRTEAARLADVRAVSAGRSPRAWSS
jgi:hypothetical protein